MALGPRVGVGAALVGTLIRRFRTLHFDQVELQRGVAGHGDDQAKLTARDGLDVAAQGWIRACRPRVISANSVPGYFAAWQ